MPKRPVTTTHISARTKWLVVTVFVAVGLAGLYFGNPVQRFRESEKASCRNTCSKLNKAPRLVSHFATGMVAPGKFDGPWRCECY